MAFSCWVVKTQRKNIASASFATLQRGYSIVRVKQSYNSWGNFRLVSSQVPPIFHFLPYWHLLGIPGSTENCLGEWVNEDKCYITII